MKTVFFFSSRRRHTRCYRDWSSDVCSSDLAVCGIYNVGTGNARSFRDMILTMFEALGRPAKIDYVEMPPAIQASYQYFTQAPVENLRRAGYPGQFAPLEHSVRDYVTNYLDAGDRYR